LPLREQELPVADELVLKHPAGHSDLNTVLSAIGGFPSSVFNHLNTDF